MGYFYLLGIRTLSVGKFTVDFSTVNENVLELSRETINLSLRRLAQQDCFNRADHSLLYDQKIDPIPINT